MRHPKCHGIQLGVTKYVSYTSSGSIRVKILLLKVFLFYSFQFINVSIAVLQGRYGSLRGLVLEGVSISNSQT